LGVLRADGYDSKFDDSRSVAAAPVAAAQSSAAILTNLDSCVSTYFFFTHVRAGREGDKEQTGCCLFHAGSCWKRLKGPAAMSSSQQPCQLPSPTDTIGLVSDISMLMGIKPSVPMYDGGSDKGVQGQESKTEKIGTFLHLLHAVCQETTGKRGKVPNTQPRIKKILKNPQVMRLPADGRPMRMTVVVNWSFSSKSSKREG
jgi:hypothetical protein